MVLSTNISFLSIPGQLYVSQPRGGVGPNASQLVTYVSALFSVGAIISGLMLSRQLRGHRRDNIEDDPAHLVSVPDLTLAFTCNSRDINMSRDYPGRVFIWVATNTKPTACNTSQ